MLNCSLGRKKKKKIWRGFARVKTCLSAICSLIDFLLTVSLLQFFSLLVCLAFLMWIFLSLFVLSFFWCLERDVLRDCGVSGISSLTFLNPFWLRATRFAILLTHPLSHYERSKLFLPFNFKGVFMSYTLDMAVVNRSDWRSRHITLYLT